MQSMIEIESPISVKGGVASQKQLDDADAKVFDPSSENHVSIEYAGDDDFLTK